jgi:hypothetical protein
MLVDLYDKLTDAENAWMFQAWLFPTIMLTVAAIWLAEWRWNRFTKTLLAIASVNCATFLVFAITGAGVAWVRF